MGNVIAEGGTRTRGLVPEPGDHQNRRRISWPGRPGTFMSALAALAAAAVLTLTASGAAQAATAARPSASLSLAAASIHSGTGPELTYMTADLPAGSVIYLQRGASTGQAWQNVGRLTAAAGTVRAPADAAGHYAYRILVSQAGRAVAISNRGNLTVTGTQASAGCAACKALKSAIPWLAPLVEPIIQNVIQQAGQIVLGLIGALFGF
jgi:hypothetical protein